MHSNLHTQRAQEIRNFSFSKDHLGFTLVELMVAVAVFGILVALAAPAFSTLIADQRIKSGAREMLRNIQYARSEAVSRNSVINMARSSGTAKLWEAGWTIYTDDDRAGNAAQVVGDTLLRTVDAQSGDITIRSGNIANNWLSFSPDGSLNEGGNTALFVICDDRGAASGRTINVSTIGRAKLESATFNTISCTP